MKILIIEDNEQIVKVLTRYLNEAGYETDVVYDGKDALPYFDCFPVDFILLDIFSHKKNTGCKKTEILSVARA